MTADDLLYSKLVTDMMSEGFIAIDNKGIIQIYNESAKEIFGIKNKSDISHNSGSLRKGDLVIIANNSFGSDDGNMDDDSLRLLGLDGGELDSEDAFILISRYREENILLTRSIDEKEKMEVAKEVDDIDVYSYIDFKNKKISIAIDDNNFDLNYIKEIGHMVILDGNTKKLKFYQTNGYTARKESINDILKGGDFKEKGKESDLLKVLGKDVFDIHSSESIIQDFYELAKGKNLECIDKPEDINGYPTLCTLKAIEVNGDRKGAALIVEDISKMEEIISQRDNLLRELEETSQSIREHKEFKKAFPNFIGEDEKILEVKRLALRATKTMSPVLIMGQSGVGKSLLAKSIHKSSKVSDGDFIQLSGNRLSSLEGIKTKGTLYIDNIDALSLDLQGELLDLLENEEYSSLRFIASTSKNLDEKIIAKEFKDDLYFRINIIPIYIPRLKDRKGDIEMLVDHLLPRICEKAGIEEKRVSREAMDLITSYHWPNNVRELENVLERAVNYALGNNILTKHIVLLGDMNRVDNKKLTLKEALEEREKTIIQSTLSLHKGDRKKTIEDLGISQSTFYEKLNKYGIS